MTEIFALINKIWDLLKGKFGGSREEEIRKNREAIKKGATGDTSDIESRISKL